MPERYSAAEVASLRTLMGLSQDQMAIALGVNKKTIQDWETGKATPSESASGAIWELKNTHDQLVQRMVDADAVVAIDNRKAPDAPMPRGWYLAGAGRAMDREPGLMVEWL